MALFCYGRVLATKHSYFLQSLRIPSRCSSIQYSNAKPTKIQIVEYCPPKPEEHDLKNMRLGRPMSPHLTIYAPQLTSFTSIMHRITGMAVSGYIIALGCGALVLPNDISTYAVMIENLNLSPATIFTAKLILASPFGYHLANGIRHLLWDTGRGLTLKEVYSTGYAMLGASAVISIILASL